MATLAWEYRVQIPLKCRTGFEVGAFGLQFQCSIRLDTLSSYKEKFILTRECTEMLLNEQILTGGPWVPGRPGVPGDPLLPCQII